jgi:hypothetical protein
MKAIVLTRILHKLGVVFPSLSLTPRFGGVVWACPIHKTASAVFGAPWKPLKRFEWTPGRRITPLTFLYPRNVYK